jgi:hypothetical protein
MNSAIDFTLRSLETDNLGKDDLANSSGSRSYRLHHLLAERYYGKINIQSAKEIISDHYDEYLNKDIRNSRGICRHTELDPTKTASRLPFYPFGSLDGKVVNSDLAKRMEFWGRWGSPCGRVFYVSDFIKKHPEYKNMRNTWQILPMKNGVNYNILYMYTKYII